MLMTSPRGEHAIDSKDLDLLVTAAREAGREALRYFRNDVKIWWKNEGTSPVTAADHAANDILRDRLMAARPDYGWLSEESEDAPERLSRERVFIIDPIDGTRAFMNGKETWVVSAAVTDNGLPVAGVLYAPALDECYVATAAGRVEKNGVSLPVRRPSGAIRRISGAEDLLRRFAAVLPAEVERVKNAPSLAYRLAMIADGRLDATLVKANAHDWDLAAAHLILANTGGRLADLRGEDPVYNRPLPRHDILVAAADDQALKALLSAI